MTIIGVLFYFATFSAFLSLLIVVVNYFSAAGLDSGEIIEIDNELVSVLIPMRNEEKNAGVIIESVLNQSYPNIEILIVDDNSTDRTLEIIRKYESNNSNITVMEGKPLEPGWLGKNYACNTMAVSATGKYYLFVDADVELQPDVIEKGVSKLKREKLSLLTIFPTQKISGVGPGIVTPMMNWLLLAFLPIALVKRVKSVSVLAANGQFMFFNADDYKKIGGHEAVKNEPVEDMALGAKIKREGLIVETVLGLNSAKCKMYDSFYEAFVGFSKNFYSGSKLGRVRFSVLMLFLFLVFLLPVLLLPFYPVFTIPVILLLISRVMISILSHHNVLRDVLLHPIQMIILLSIGVWGMLNEGKKRLLWKGRTI